MKYLNLLSAAVVLSAAFSFGSCSDESTPDFNKASSVVKKGEIRYGTLDYVTISRYADGLENATYTPIDFALFYMDKSTGGKWKQEKELLDGYESGTPDRVIINDGKLWTPIKDFSCATGPTYFAMALWAVNLRTGSEYSVYIAQPFKLDPEERILTINNNSYGVIAANAEGLILSYESNWVTGNGETGKWLDVTSYKLSKPLNFTQGKDLEFESDKDAYDWLIETFEELFGEKANLNLLQSGIIFDQPYIYLNDIKEERDKRNHI